MNNIERLPLDPLSMVTGTIEPSTIEPSRHTLKSTASFWQVLWQSLLHLPVQADEPRVWQRLDRFKNLYWQAYDPATGRSASYTSDAEMRAWLEELRYRQ